MVTPLPFVNKNNYQLKLSAECVQLNVYARSAEEAIRQACEPLVLLKRVRPAYINDVILREERWPTGIPTNPGIAIPHAENYDNTITSTIASCVLANSIPFRQMGSKDQLVDVRILFILAIKEPDIQVDVISNLMRFLTGKSAINNLIKSKTQQEFIDQFEGK
jgi:PTS system galactitol-specific IIA component